MTESWFRRAEDDLRHVTAHFHRHAPTIASNSPASTLEPAMPLADTANDLQTTSGNLRAAVSESLTHLRILDDLIGDVGVIAKIADSPLVVAAAGALHVPPEVLDGFVKGLTALAAAFPKPEPVAPEQPAEVEPQPEQPAA